GAGTSRAQGDSHHFPETNHTVSGIFWTYWQTHGGLAQQGYPISDEIQEKSDLNGQTYTVQYFERAVFEKHPENQPPYDVLLSQLGTFQHRCKYEGGKCAGGAAPTATPQTVPPTQPPPPTATPSGPTCDTSGDKNGSASPSSGKAGDTIQLTITGFTPNE